MELSEAKVRELNRRLLLSRTRVLCSNGFYGLLLMHLKYVLNTEMPTAYTDGDEIGFNPEFMEQLSDSELDFVMMHEILHVVLQHCTRYEKDVMDPELWNIACDIVVNSNILKSCDMKLSSISLRAFGGEAMHLTPKGDEGHLYTMEEVYAMLEKEAKKQQRKQGGGSGKNGKGGGQGKNDQSNQNGQTGQKNSGDAEDADGQNGNGQNGNGPNGRQGGRGGQARKLGKGIFDDHSKWQEKDEAQAAEQAAKWQKRMMDAAETMRIADPDNARGTVPAGVGRLIEELRRPKLDWRTILNEFVQEEITDYSFSPPDKRFDGYDFYLPDYNETEEKLGNILFMIDTSGSVSDKMMTEAYSEICGAIEQFSGKLSGKLGFFDAQVYGPVPFENVDDVKAIRPRGGGGTSFHVIFDYVRREMEEELPISIIILTDGYAPFPDETAAMGIPVLWVLNNAAGDVEPPWGRVARLA